VFFYYTNQLPSEVRCLSELQRTRHSPQLHQLPLQRTRPTEHPHLQRRQGARERPEDFAGARTRHRGVEVRRRRDLRELRSVHFHGENKDSLTVIPVFHGVDPCHVRRQIEKVAVQFEKHEKREGREKVLSWRQALTNLANISGVCTLKCEDDSMMVDEIAKRISTLIDTTRKPTRTGSNLVGIDVHMKALSRLLDLNSSKKSVRVIGIWGRGGNGRSALAEFVYKNICQHFESHCFLENVKRISQDRHMSHLHQEVLKRVQVESNSNQKVLLVANEVNKLEQLDALAEDFSCFGPGSIVIITTQDKQLLVSAGIKLVYEAELLTFQKVRELFRQLGFRVRERAIESVLCKGTNLAMKWLGCCLRVRSGYRKVS
ncbi:unnamed protein product, partial [Brassica oleracea]